VDEGITLAKQKNIYIAFQLEKNVESDSLYIKAVFDPSAPNIKKTKDTLIWKPFYEEIDLMNEVFSLLPNQQVAPFEHLKPHGEEQRKPIKDVPEVIEKILPGAKAEKEPTSDSGEEQKLKEFEEPLESEEEKQQEVTNGDKVLVAADDKTIDEIVKRKREGTLKEASDDSILEKILRQKKRGEL
jgi:hypothetical protein